MKTIKIEEPCERRQCIVCGSWSYVKGVNFIHNRIVTEIVLCLACRGELYYKLGEEAKEREKQADAHRQAHEAEDRAEDYTERCKRDVPGGA